LRSSLAKGTVLQKKWLREKLGAVLEVSLLNLSVFVSHYEWILVLVEQYNKPPIHSLTTNEICE
jgi:hypothetical protein